MLSRLIRPQRSARRPVVEELEPRILYSADLAPLADPDTLTPEVEVRTLDDAGEFHASPVDSLHDGASAEPPADQIQAAAAAALPSESAAGDAANQPLSVDIAAAPLAFERNAGQTDAQVDFLARGSGYGVWLSDGDAVLALDDGQNTHVLRLDVLATNPAPAASGEGELDAYTNYFIGDESSWRTHVQNYAAVRYDDVYAGIDLRYYGNGHELEYDFIVEQGAEVSAIRIAFQGVESVSIDAEGNLVLTLDAAGRTLTFQAPISYQDGAGGREVVSSHYVVLDDGSIGFEVGDYDRSRELVIDPILAYGTYLGGSGGEQIWNMETDAAGNVYVTGYTSSTNFPLSAGAFSGPRGNQDVFVSKFSADLSTLLYSTYVGGTNDENGYGIAVDTAGNAYVTGATKSSDFPKLAALDSSLDNGQDVFVFKLNATGNALIYSTYLRGAGSLDTGYGIAVDAAGNAYVVGYTDSSDFALTAGALDTSFSNGEAFVTKLSASGSALVYSTYFGGSVDETIYNIAVDGLGNAVVVGESNSTTFSFALPGAYQSSNGSTGSRYDAFVAKLNSSGTGLLYGSFIGGSQDDFGYGVALGPTGRIYISGDTNSNNFDVTSGAMQTARAGGADGFAAVFDPSLSGAASLVYSTYIGGSATESFWGIDVDAAGRMYLGGYTNSNNMTVTADAHRTTNAGGDDIFVVAVDTNGASSADRVYASYLGGSSAENAWAARYSNGKFYVAGNAASASGVTTAGAYDTSFNGGFDGYVAAFAFETPPVLGGAGGTLAYSENSGAVAIAPALTVSDSDSATLTGATVAITANYNSAEDVLAFVNAFGITGSWSAAAGTLTLTGAASVANYQAALRSVTYQNTSEKPGTLVRTITFTASDASLTGAAVSRQISVASLNDAPIHATPGAQSVDEDGPLVFSTGNGNAISVSDVDAGTSPLQITLAAANGRLTLAQTTGLSFTTGDGSNDASMTFSGTAANLNAALNGLRFDPFADFNGSGSLQVTTSDLGNSGSGGTQTADSTIAITVNAVNDAPVHSVPGAQATLQNTQLVFSSGTGNAITVSDIDAGSGELTLTLGVTNGTLTLGGVAGLSSVTGDATASITMTGTLLNLNAALNGLGFMPSAGYSGPATLTVATSDLGNSGAGGIRTDSDAIAITVSPNIAPTVTMIGGSLLYAEGAPAIVLDAALGVTDPDNPTLSQARLRIQTGYVQGEEQLLFVDQLGIAGAWDSATGTLTLSGPASVAAYQTALRTVTYLNTSEHPIGTRTVSVVVNDGVADSSAVTRDVVLQAQNDAPVLTVPGTQSVAEDGVLVFSPGTGNAIAIADADAGGTALRLRLTATNGSMTLLQTTGVTFVAGSNGSGGMTVDGTRDDLNAALSALRFDPSTDYAGAASVEVEVDDLGNSGSGGPLTSLRSIDITVTAVNDAPAGADGSVTTDEDTPYIFSVADFGFGDPNDIPGDALLAVRIAQLPGGGTLTNDGVPVAAGSFVSAADIGAGRLKFTPFPNANGVPYATLEFQVQDTGGTADGGVDLDQVPRTLTINVSAVNDDPILAAPGAQSTAADTPLTFSAADGNALAVADIDEGGAGVGITLSVSDGTLTLSTTAGLLGLTGNGTGSVSFTAIPEAINDALEGLVFTPDAGFTGNTTLQIVVDDLGNTGSPGPLQALADVQIDVTYVAPTLATTPGAVGYTEDSAPAVIDAGLTLSGGTLLGASVQITLNHASGQDLLTYDAGLLPGGVSATWSAGTGTLDFSGTASAGAYQTLLRSVGFAATGDTPSTASRTIEFSVDDGGVGAVGTRQVSVVAVDDAPVISVIADQSINQGGSTGALAFTVSDPDTAAGSLAVSASASNATLVPGGAIAIGGVGANRTVNVTPAASESGSATITIDVFDGTSTTSQSFQLAVLPPNLPPSITPSVFTVPENSALGTAVGQVAAVDPDVEEGFDRIYYADAMTDSIVRLELGGSSATTLVTGLSSPGGVSVDYRAGKVYWADSGSNRIQRANLDGSNLQTLLSGLAAPASLAIDTEGGKLYWVEVGTAQIRRANVDGTAVESLVTTSDARALAVDHAAGKLYWVDDGDDTIKRANLDGSAVELLVSGLSAPNSIALDVSGGRMYWSDAGTGSIGRANLDGSGMQAGFLSVGSGVNGLVVDSARDHIYWTDDDLLNARIRRANLDGTGITTVTTTGLPLLSDPTGIALGPAVPALSYAITGGNTGGAFAIDAAGRLTVANPAVLDFETTPSFALGIQVTDAGGAVSTETVTIDLSNVNEPPTISSIASQVILEDTSTGAIAFTISDWETAPDALVLTAFSSDTTRIPNANIVLGGSGNNRTVTVTPAADAYGGPANVTVRVSDGTNIVQSSFAVAITGTADTPNVTAAATAEDTQTSAGLVITRNSADGGEVTHFKITGIAGGALYLANGTTPVVNDQFITLAQGSAGLKFTPAPDSTSAGSFNVQASTSPSNGGLSGGIATATISVTPVNDAPSAVVLAAAPLLEGTDTAGGAAAGTLSTTDVDAPDAHSYSIVGGADAARFSVSGTTLLLDDGVLDYDAQSSYEVTVRSTDSGGLFFDQTFTVLVADVNDAPVVVPPSDLSMNEDSASALAFTVSDPETAAASLLVTVSSSDESIIPTASLVLGGSGGTRTIAIAPAADAYGVVTITLSVFDGSVTSLATFEVTVFNVPDGVVVVNTTSDASDGDTSSIDALRMNRGADGVISLREAIEAANNGPNAGVVDRIEFDIAGAGPHTIDLLAALPAITEAVVIDGTTDADYAGTPIIELNGAGAGSDVDGLVLLGDASVVRGLVIERFDGSGIVLDGGGAHTVTGNYIGLDASGATDRGNGAYGIWIRSDGNTIGGTSAGDRNVVSGNDIDGIHIDGVADNVVQGNYIGTDATGLIAVGNAEDGIWLAGAFDNLIGGTAPGAGNVLSGNLWSGIGASGLSQDNVIQGNYVGVDATGSGALGNQRAGMRIEDGTGTVVGGAGGAQNVIAYNVLDGISIVSGSGHSVLENAIYANGGLGIDLGDDGVTPNDAGDGDSGTNQRLNFPVIYSAVVAGGNVTIAGEARPGAMVRFFQAASDASGYGEGQTFLGAVLASGATDGQLDATARQFSVTFAAGGLTAADSITATATDGAGNTSEFARAVNGINDAPTALWLSNLSASEGVDTTGGYTVGTLSTDDPEVLDVHTYSIVGGADAASFSISGDALVIDAGVLDYETKSSYVVTVRSTDIGGLTRDQSFTINVTNVNDAPVLVNSAGASVAWGGTAVIGTGALQVSDVDNSTAQLVYALTAAPGAGTLRLSGAVLGVNATFTQADVDAGRVSYVHNGAGGGPDGFSVTVSDGSAGLGPVVMSVGIGSPPIIVVPDPIGPPAPPPAPTEPEPSPTDTTTDPEPSDTSSSDPGTGSADGNIPAPIDGGGGIAPGMEGLLDEGQISSTDSAAAQRGSARIIFTDAFSLRAQLNTLGFGSALADANALARDADDPLATTADLSLPSFALRNDAATSQSVALASFKASLGDTEWMTELNRMREDIDAQLPQQSALVVSSVAVTGSLSVGYVLWLLRGGLLLSSLLSSLPAWTVIDPMPVLSRSGHDDEDEGDDPLEKLFGRARAALGLKRGKAARAARDTAEEVS
jgi:sugar lactone lactonase YvrE